MTCRLLYVGHLQQKAWRVTTKMKSIDGWLRTTCGIFKLYQLCIRYANFVRRLRVRFGELYTQFRLLTSADVHNDVFMECSGHSRDFPRLAGPSWRCSQIFGWFCFTSCRMGQAVLSFPQFQDLEPDEAIKLFSDLVDLKIEWISSEEWKMG